MTYGAGIQRGPMAADNFTQIANALFRDRRISFKAKGIFGLVSTHTEGWHVTVADLVRSGTDGKAAITTGLKELERYGYLVRDRERRDDGTLGDAVYSITDVPAHLFDLFGDDAAAVLENMQSRSSQPKSENPALDDPVQANRTTKNNSLKKTNKQNTKTRPSVRTAKGSANKPETEGPTSESAAEEKPPQAPTRVAVAPTEGVLLLTAIGSELPAFRLTGKTLRDQGLLVDGLLASGWSPEQIRDVVADRPLPEKLTKTVGAVISSRIGAAADSPAPSVAPLLPRQAKGWHDQDQAPDEETYTAPAFGEHIASPRFHEYTGDDRGIPCGKPCDPVTGLCREHSGERPCPVSGCPRWTPNTGPCDTCGRELAEAEAAFQHCIGAPPLINEPTEAERLVDLGGGCPQ
ncbi:hypothetical protein ACGFYQ_27515 [Streptomyces sp. NPDC048258]|uniref:hypothetical protein n=1 Tax=Streptomyces sp. NPDC048258 TaxID=3365527 RepID=UPI0037150B40